TPITMKKSRPATQITVICKLENAQFFEDYVLKNTSTLGIRSYTVNRKVLHRQFETIHTNYGAILVKKAMLNEKIIKKKQNNNNTNNKNKRKKNKKKTKI